MIRGVGTVIAVTGITPFQDLAGIASTKFVILYSIYIVNSCITLTNKRKLREFSTEEAAAERKELYTMIGEVV